MDAAMWLSLMAYAISENARAWTGLRVYNADLWESLQTGGLEMCYAE